MNDPLDEIAEQTEPQAPVPQAEVDRQPSEEYEVWWGSYSGWTMTPSWTLCLFLPILVAFAAWLFVPRGFLQITVFGVAGAVWLFQLVRWGYRVFGYNYRLTNRRLFCDTGFLYTDRVQVDLRNIAQVEVKIPSFQAFLGTGTIIVARKDGPPPVVLKGVRQPRVAATLIREYAKHA